MSKMMILIEWLLLGNNVETPFPLLCRYNEIHVFLSLTLILNTQTKRDIYAYVCALPQNFVNRNPLN